MTNANKIFKIGEYAIGGKIQVQIVGKLIMIKALDWDSNKEIMSGSVMSNDSDCHAKIDSFLNELTSYYYAEQIINWIRTKININ